MIRHGLPEKRWRKSSYSPDNGGNCVEIQVVDGAAVALGDSKVRALGAFIFSAGSWGAFVAGVKSNGLNG